MPGALASLSAGKAVALVLAGVLLAVAAIWAYRAWQRSRITPQDRERQRRATLVAFGKMGDANLVDIREDHLFYCYDVRGVEYTASQDISLLRKFVPADLSAAGAVYVKYDARNPANSIVVSEQWSGMRASRVG
ncbi:MAG TPA: hypothetical protein VGS58_22305 [Candidatus Sulfopaludibacter sp.]|nr:hypothetical protein [Candidatus Sulfopaludibacter sp.]